MNNGIIYNGQFNLSKGIKNFLNLGTIFGRYNSILLKNNGVISGYADEGSGKGLFISNSTPHQNIQDAIKTIINNGIIKGNETGIFTSQLIYLNNGILAGKTPSEGVNFTNNGLKIFLDSNGGINKIEIGNGGNVDGKEIVNDTLSGNDSFTLASQLKINDNIIINGAGTLKGSLVVDNDSTIYNTIINGYNTALFLEDNTNFVGSNIVINGGGLKNNVAVVKGSDGENSLKLLGDSIVNGNLELENGNDNLVVSNTVQLNGSLDGGLGEDNLNFRRKKGYGY